MSVYPPEISAERPQATAAEIAAERRALIAKRLAIGAVAVTLIVILCSVAGGVWLIRSSQVHNSPKVEATNESAQRIEDTADRIEECTTPGMDCYERGQQQLKDTVAGLNRYGLVVASCSSGSVAITVEELNRCVLARLNPPRRSD